MAPVIDSAGDRDRAQLILVGGLALAVTVVVLALVLNSAIYTHNLASRSDTAAEESVQFDGDTRRGVGGLLDSVNREEVGDDFGALQTDYETALGSWESSARNLSGSNGRAVSVTRGSEREGVRIADQTVGGTTFHPASGTPNSWTVSTEAHVRQFDMNVTAGGGDLVSRTLSDIESSLLGSDSFTVVFEDGSTEWQVAIYENGNTGTTDVNVTVHEDGTSTYETCTVDRADVVVDFTDAEVGTDTCEPLTFLADLDGPIEVRFENAGNSQGNYELTVDRVVDDPTGEVGPFTAAVDAANYGYHCGESGTPKQTYYSADSGNFPRVSPAIYSAEFETEVIGSDTTVRGEHRAAPDEPGPEPTAPRVTRFDVSEGTDSDGAFEVDWTVEDPNGNLERVYITVNGNMEADVSVNGDSESGSDTSVSGSSTPYTIEVTVEDSDGHSRSTTRTHDDDASIGGCPA